MNKKKSWVLARIVAVALSLTLGVAADDALVRFDGGIGVIPVSSAAGPQNADGTFSSVNRNDVRNVPPAGQIWVIRDLKAVVDPNGRILVHGKGLLLGGGNNIGTNANASVFATLFSGNQEFSSDLAGVPLAPNGDFEIDDVLTPAPPSPVVNPVLLIRTTNGGRWFAAGIPAGN